MLRVLAVALLFCMLCVLSYYVSARLYKGISALWPKVRFIFIWPVFMFLSLCTVLGFGASLLPFSNGFKNVLKVIAFYWMGIFIYLLLFTLTVDLFIAVCRLCKRTFINKRSFKILTVILVLVLTVSTSVYGFYNAYQIDTVAYEVKIQNKIDVSDIDIVLISDLHLGAVGSEQRLKKIVDQINSCNPDVLFIAGDFFDTDFASIKQPEKAIKTLKSIKTTYGVYASLGNHDAGDSFDQMEAFLNESNITVLKEESVVIDNRLVLIGRLDERPIGRFNNESRKELSQFYERKDKNLPVIVLDHNPQNINTYNDEVDLILSGHTHKGQLFPANLITGIIYDVDYGYYRKTTESPQVIVTSGVGYWGMPMRVGSNSEIVKITIKQ